MSLTNLLEIEYYLYLAYAMLGLRLKDARKTTKEGQIS